MATRPPPGVRPGAIIASRFQLERQLGQGSMGSVWRARHTGLQTTVAVKFMAPELGERPELIMRFAHEARAAAQIKSPHVVGVLDFGTDDEGRSYIAMEYLQGEDLGAALDRQESLPLEDVARVVRHAASGLTKAHAAGIIHRDIKPENLFLARDDDEGEYVVKILDFGVAKLDFGANPHQTQFGQTVGSPVYMSPEQARGLAIDARTDLFSLGVVAYQCLTGQVPFGGWTVSEVFDALLADTPAPPSVRSRGLPPSVDRWVERALQKDPAKRFQTAAEMAEALVFCLADGAPAARPGAGPARPIVSARRPGPADRDAPPPGRTQTAPGAAPAPLPSSAGLEGPLRRVLDLPDVYAVAVLDGGGRQLASLRSPTAPDVPVERAFQQVHAFAQAEGARLGDDRLVLLRFASAAVLAHRSGDHHLIALASADVNVVLLRVLLHVTARRLERLGELGGATLDGATGAGAARSRAPLPLSAQPAPWLSPAPPAPRDTPRSARGPAPSDPPPPSVGVWFSPSAFAPPEAESPPSAPPAALRPVSAKAAAPPAWQQNALVVMRVSLALGKYLGRGAHRVVKREMARLNTANEHRSLLELLDALGVFVEDSAARDAFFREAQGLIAGAPRGGE
jgi:hypothetical protein